jgi:16S rRNA (cytidine1402-2'-O)-methyltransferase
LKKGILYLIPNTLGSGPDAFATEQSKQVVATLDTFIVEEIKSARRLLRSLGIEGPLEIFDYHILNEHTRASEQQAMIEPLLKGKNIGLISEAGLPCVADPGHSIVALAHEQGIRVVPLSGPSSIMMALMASGMNGQEFVFHGYLPREKSDRQKKIRAMEQMALKGQTQIFMDAPYRNQQVFEDLLATLKMDTRLCVAKNISMHDEWIMTKDVTGWHMKKTDLNKVPVMFVMGGPQKMNRD